MTELFPKISGTTFSGYIKIDGRPFNDPVVAIGLLFERRTAGWEVTSLPVHRAE